MHDSLARKASALLAVLAAVTFSAPAHTAGAQTKPAAAKAGRFGLGYTDIGPTIGFGGMGEASASFGGRFERAIAALPNFGDGILGIEASFDYYSWSGPGASFRYLPIGVTANYHLKIASEPRFDPFLGLGLGYRIISCDIDGLGSCSNSDMVFVGRAGARYFLKPNMAGYADLGTGVGAFHLGVMFKLK